MGDDRKYKHRGYQDSGSSSSSSNDRGSSRPPMEPRKERLEGAPRGRSAGGFGPEVFKCARCGDAQRALGEIEIEQEAKCGKCSNDLHTCWNCKNFDTSTRWECKVAIPARVAPKDAGNQCTFFAPKMIRDLSQDKAQMPKTANDARAAFEALFKK